MVEHGFDKEEIKQIISAWYDESKEAALQAVYDYVPGSVADE